MNEEQVIVFKDKKSRQIETYVSLDGHGARVDVKDFIAMCAELYGSPATTMTRAGLKQGMLEACEKAIRMLKSSTREVAAVNLEPPQHSQP